MILSSYEPIEILHESSRSLIRRARRRSDGEVVVLKTPTAKISSAEHVARYRNEHALCSMIDSPKVVEILELIDEPAQVGLVVRDYAGFESLAVRGLGRQLGLRESLRVALGLLDALAVIHAKNIVHKDIKPDNVLVDSALERVVLIDFGIASVVPRDLKLLAANTQLEGTLGFMAPEQTGRINRRVDYRSDLYGVGATLHWMLAGRRPFADISEHGALVHAHIARVPPLLSELHAHVPPVLARIVAKLLSKNADERYQGTYGLRKDLERCLETLDGDQIPDFDIAKVDPAEHLQLGQGLYGRQRQLAALHEELDRSVSRAGDRPDQPQLVVVTGSSGAGKSALIAAFQEIIVEAGVSYASGKFDQFSQERPYAAISQALRALLSSLVDASACEADDPVLGRVREALGPNGGLLVELVPELVELLGPQPQVPPAGPGETRDRFLDTLAAFAEALFVPDREIVMFIDDLQWADLPSLRLIQSLCRTPAPGLTIVLAVRDDELDAGHPVVDFMEQLAEQAVAPRRVELPPLSVAEIDALLADAFEGETSSAAFAELIHRRTGGVPLYVNQLLLALYHEGIVDIERARGQWSVDLERANAWASSGDVVEFLAASLGGLDERSREVLGIAACVGGSFELATLAAICDTSLVDITKIALAAVASGHLLPIDAPAGPAKASSATSTVGGARRYAFAHDRIQQVALEALPDERAELHLLVARRLIEREGRGEHLHTLAGHIAAAGPLVSDAAERARFAKICAEAGASTKASTAYEAAARHYAVAIELLGSDAPELALDSTLELGECQFMAGHREQAEATFARARERAKTRLELLRLLTLQGMLAMLPGDFERALEILMEVAERFELDLRRGADQGWLGARMGAVLGLLGARGPQDIAAAPITTDPEQLLLGHLLLVCSNAAYFAGDVHLYGGIALTLVSNVLEHGLTDVAAIGFTQVALLCAAGGQYELARSLSKIGAAILERFPDSVMREIATTTYTAAVQTYLEPIHSAAPALEAAYVGLRNAGMRSTAGYAANLIPMIGVSSGLPLHTVEIAATRARDYIAGLGDVSFARTAQTYVRVCEVLTSPTGAAAELRVPERPAKLAPNPTAEYAICAATTLAFIFLRAPRRAHEMIEAIEPFRMAGTGMYLSAMFDALSVVNACERWPLMDEAEREALRRRMPEVLAALSSWRQSCPENARALHDLARGAWARARGDIEEARVALTSAADAAAEDGFPHLEGLANELAAELVIERGERRLAIGYLEFALAAYGRWGARACERRVRQRLREFVHLRELPSERVATRPSTETTLNLDVASITKMSQAMSESTRFEEVAARLLCLASENAGADRSVLLLQRDDQLEVYAELRDDEFHVFAPPRPLDETERLLASPVVRAAVRLDEAVIIDDALRDPRCRRDPYCLGEGLHSLCVSPIVKHGQRVGLLYLENRVTAGAFSREHLGVLAILGSQAAITLDNARLFDALRESEEQWRSLVNSAPDSIMLVDREHRIEFVNDHGFDPRASQGATVEDQVIASDRERVASAIDYVFETGETTAYDATLDGPEGRRSVTTRLGPVEIDDVVERVTLITTDVTERRMLEEQLRQAQKMQAVGTLAGGVAHDFNNLLTIILGACELAELELDAGHSALELLAEINAGARRATELTGQLLAFSRKQVLQPRLLDLRTRVTQTAKMLTRLIGEDIQFELETAAVPCLVRVDPGQIEQVLINLAVNARDAMGEGGTLTVRVRPASSDEARADGPQVVLEVIDTGVGMSPELLERVFEPFFTTKQDGKGTGLGLSTVLGIVEQSGGRLEVDSQPGRGTRVRAFLPWIPGVPLDEQVSASTELPRGTETVLVVEDEAAVRTLISRLLTMQGYTVLSADSSEQALALGAEHPRIDLVLTDVVMPGASGRDVAQAFQRSHPGIAVLYTSGYTDDAIMRHGVLDGTAAFLQKPFTREALAFEVRRVFDG